MPLSPVDLWLIAGLVLIFLEFVVPGFVICFFGGGALLVAGALAIWPDLGSAAVVGLFIVFSLALLFGVRRFLPKTFRGRKEELRADPDSDDVAGSHVKVVEAIAPNVPGKVEFRGSLWIAAADTDISADAVVEVVRRDNLTLFVRPL